MTGDEFVLRATQFTRDVIASLRSVGDHQNARILEDTLRLDGPDIDGCVTSLDKNGLVTRKWVDRLTALNEDHDLDEELAELVEYYEEQRANA